MDKKITVSAIVSAYNSARFIEGCIEDLESQTLAHELEIIIIDSNSPQNEGEIVSRLQQKYRNITCVRTQERETVYGAWNRGIALAQGDYVTNANTDDRHRPDFLERMAGELERRPEIALVYADCAVTRQENCSFYGAPVHAQLLWPEYDSRLIFGKCIIGPQPLWRRSLHDKYGAFDAAMVSAGDYTFWLKLTAHGEQFHHIPELLGLYLESETSIEHRNQKISDREAKISRKALWPKQWGKTRRHRGIYLFPVTPYVQSPPVPVSPLASVIIPTCNRPGMLINAIKSVLRQTMENFEIIVVNDGAGDVTPSLENLDAKGRIRLINNNGNRGRSFSRNAGIRAASGKYIAYLDDDDVYYPGHLETACNFLESTNRDAAYTDAWCEIQEKKDGAYVTVRKELRYSHDFHRRMILWRNFIPMLCLVHSRTCCERAGYFDETLDTCEDWEFIIRLSQKYDLRHVNKITAAYSFRYDGSSTTSGSAIDFLRSRVLVYRKHKELWKNDARIKRKQRQALRDYKTYLLKTGVTKKELRKLSKELVY